MLGNTSNQPSKFRTKNWTTMLKSSLFDYSNAYILVKGRIIITGAGYTVANRQADERNKGVVFKNCVPCTN